MIGKLDELEAMLEELKSEVDNIKMKRNLGGVTEEEGVSELFDSLRIRKEKEKQHDEGDEN